MNRVRPWASAFARSLRSTGPWPPPTCIIHVGTHKTGSTTIQHFLASNAAELGTEGTLIPRSGRLAETPEGSGHHCIAWDVLGADPGAPIDGSLERLIEEIRVAAQPRVCISSEELSHLHAVPNNMQRLRQGLRAIGYRPVIVMYLRPQADYLEAFYAEVAQHALVRDFWACYREVLKHGAVDFWHDNRFSALFDYMRLIAPFERVFGKENVIVRPFRRFASPEQLIRDFLRIVNGPASTFRPRSLEHVSAVTFSPTKNSRSRFAAVITSVSQNRSDRLNNLDRVRAIQEEANSVDGPFEVLRSHEIAHICWRFTRTNLALLVRYRVWVGSVSSVRLFRLIAGIAALRQRRIRVKLLRALFTNHPA